MTSQGKSAIDAIRSIGVTDATYYRWRQKYGGLKIDQVKRMQVLEAENTRLRRAVSDLTLEKLVLNEGSCIRLRPERANHVWAYDFMEDRTHDGRKIRMLNIVDEFTREAMAIRVSRRLNSRDVIDVLSDLFILRGIPAHIRSNNGPELIAKTVQAWITDVGAQTAYITPGSPWGETVKGSTQWGDPRSNGYIESFNTRLRDEFFNGEIF